MCFSASASFTAAGILGVIGLLSLRQIRGHKQYAAVAMVPLLFALQQAAEGVVWLTLDKPAFLQLNVAATYIFLFFAMCVWPSWVPLSLWLCEPKRDKKRVIGCIGLLGVLVSFCCAYILVHNTIQVEVFNCSIWYNIAMRSIITRPVDLGIYAFTVLAPLFITSLPRAAFFGVAVLGSLIFTYMFMTTTLISVWCFFAAILSSMIYWGLRDNFRA